MASDYYDDEEAAPASAKASDKGATSTGLLPKSVLMGRSVEVGDELTFKVTAIHGDEIQVECDASTTSDEETKEPEAETTSSDQEESGEPVSAPADAGGDMYD